MKIWKRIWDLILIGLVVGFFISAISALHFQSSFITVVSASMEPKISAGDTLLLRNVKSSEIKRNDIVVLPLPGNKSVRYSHRVLVVAKEPNAIVLQTKGDANPNPDKWLIRVTSKAIPRVVAVIPTAAIFAGPIERKWIFYFLIFVAAALFLIASFRLMRGVRPKSHSR